MPKTIIYQKPSCTTCRKVYAALKDSGVDFDAIDYYTNPIPRSKIKNLLSKMNITAAEILRTKEPIYKELKLAQKKYSDDELIDLMEKHPELIERPIVERGSKAILARPAERILEILPVSAKGRITL